MLCSFQFMMFQSKMKIYRKQHAVDHGYIYINNIFTSILFCGQVSRGKRVLTSAVSYTALQLSEDSREFLISSQRQSPIVLDLTVYGLFIIGAGSEGADVSVYDNKTATPSLLFVKLLSPYEIVEVTTDHADLPEDITGLYLKADRPIVMYSGHQCGNVPIDVKYCDPLLQQVPPLPLVGTEYIMGPIMQREDAGYTVRVIVTQKGTDIVLYIESGTVTLSYRNRRRRCTLRRIGDTPKYKVNCKNALRVGQYLEFHVTPATSPLAVNCSYPCYVYQMNHGGDEQSIQVKTDPFMSLVRPIGSGSTMTRGSTITRFSTTSSLSMNNVLIYRNFVSVIAPLGHNMLLDGELLSTDESLSVGEYVAYYKEIQHGFHEVQTEDGVPAKIAVQVYGHGGPSHTGRTAYGLPADYIGECVCVFVESDALPTELSGDLMNILRDSIFYQI